MLNLKGGWVNSKHERQPTEKRIRGKKVEYQVDFPARIQFIVNDEK